MARLIFGERMNIQAPPNLRPEALAALIGAGINDWGGVSPVTPDHVNPEAPWPHLEALSEATERAGRTLVERLAAYPESVVGWKSRRPRGRGPAPRAPGPRRRRALAYRTRWLDEALRTPTLRLMDGQGYAREEGWVAGGLAAPAGGAGIARQSGQQMSAPLGAIWRGRWRARRCRSADRGLCLPPAGRILLPSLPPPTRCARKSVGDTVTYVVNRNINYTNICTYGCKFCAFSKGRHNLGHRDAPYDLDAAEIGRRTSEAWQRGATEVCLQGGIRPGYTGETYLGIVAAVKSAVPQMHVHAFSPLEIWHGAATLGLPLRGLPGAAQGGGPGEPARHGGRNPR